MSPSPLSPSPIPSPNTKLENSTLLTVEPSPLEKNKGFFVDESEPLLRCDSTSSGSSALSRTGSFITKGTGVLSPAARPSLSPFPPSSSSWGIPVPCPGRPVLDSTMRLARERSRLRPVGTCLEHFYSPDYQAASAAPGVHQPGSSWVSGKVCENVVRQVFWKLFPRLAASKDLKY